MKFIQLTIPILFFSIGINACYHDNEEELYGIEICNPDTVSYSTHIVPIIQTNCFRCHSTKNASALGRNIVLEGHFNVKSYADNDLLVKSIKHIAPAEPMPKNGNKLSDCNISLIETWINNGAENN